jgi:hypothetical protein
VDKPLIDALKREPYSKKDLIEILHEAFPSDSREAIRKRLERAIKKLKILGLVTERDGEYCWYIYPNFLDENYNVKLEHSKKLIPALRRIAGERSYYDENENHIPGYLQTNDECIESHLVAYPEIWSRLKNYKTLEQKIKQKKEQMLIELDKKVKTIFGEKTIERNPSLYSKNYVSDKIPFIIYRLVSNKENINIQNFRGEIRGAGTSLAVGIQFLEKMKQFFNTEVTNEHNILSISQIEKMQQEAFKLQNEIKKSTMDLIMRINSGEPLKARCRTCPEVFNLPDKQNF